MAISVKAGTIVKHAFGLFMAVIVLTMGISQTSSELNRLMPALYPQDGWDLFIAMLSHPTAHPAYFLYVLQPLFFAISLYQLLVGFLASSIHRSFQKSSVTAIRIGGFFMLAGYWAGAVDPFMVGDAVNGHMDTMFFVRRPQDIIFMLLGLWLGTFAQNGFTLFQHAKKLRSDLDDIV